MMADRSPASNETLVEDRPLAQTGMLFLISVFGLFLELLLIRWISTEVRIFAYLQNTVLVVCFLGLGMGCWTCRRPFILREVLLPLFVLVLLLALPPSRMALSSVSEMLSVFSDLVVWSQLSGTDTWQTAMFATLGLGLTFLLMVLIWTMFVPIGRLLGRLLDDHPNTIWAYSVNIAGSLAGIWLFVAVSGLNQPPVVWFTLVGIMALLLFARSEVVKRLDYGLVAGIVGLSWLAGLEPGAMQVVWSPYQKLALWDCQQHPDDAKPSPAWRSVLLGEKSVTTGNLGEYLVTVNNVGYQVMIDLDAERVASDPKRYPPEMRGFSQYDLPMHFHPKPEKLLSVGAGTGNDVAGALRGGAKDIVAVEIDPVIIDLGRRYHPEQPYDSPAVRLVNDDARSYFATCQEKFDVIAFGLLDSHTTTAMTNARLDHYVYTRESITRARSLLNDHGIMVLSFEAQKPFIADRMARVLTEVFGEEPICFRVPYSNYGWGGVMFVAGDVVTARKQIEAKPGLANLISQWQKDYPIELTGTTPMASDDWPYIYLEYPRIPILYFLLAGVMVLLFVRGIRQLQIPTLVTGWGRTHWHFFFMGAAFLLLEVQNISKASVILGNTWVVNAVIISGILFMILLANGIAHRFPKLSLVPVYGLLCATCLALYFVDPSQFGFLSYPVKAAIVGGLTSLPMLFSGIVFIRSFAAVSRKDAALGANLFGALVGGLLQSVSFLIGIKALLLLVAGLYLSALLTRPRTQLVSGSAAAVTEPNARELEPVS